MTTIISGSPGGPRRPTPESGSQRRFAVGRMGAALVPFLLTFLILAVFWLLFSGKYDRFHILFGIAACLIVAGLNHDLLFPQGVKPGLMDCWIRFCGYIPWLLYQVFLANLHVLYLTFHPRMRERINPKMIEFDSTLKSDLSRTTLANSITLTPGTITVNVSQLGKYTVHCIDDASGRSLPGGMERRIEKVFK